VVGVLQQVLGVPALWLLRRYLTVAGVQDGCCLEVQHRMDASHLQATDASTL
jgi:hypothetical protein